MKEEGAESPIPSPGSNSSAEFTVSLRGGFISVGLITRLPECGDGPWV